MISHDRQQVRFLSVSRVLRPIAIGSGPAQHLIFRACRLRRASGFDHGVSRDCAELILECPGVERYGGKSGVHGVYLNRRPLNHNQKLLILDAPGLVSKLTFLIAGFPISKESQPHLKRKDLEADSPFQGWPKSDGSRDEFRAKHA